MEISTQLTVAHALPWYAPESWGGTEQYVAALAKTQKTQGSRVLVMAPVAGTSSLDAMHQGIAVLRWNPHAAEDHPASWTNRLHASGADVLHLHGWTPLCGPAQLQSAADMGLATVVTVHTPAVVCATGTKLHCGETLCDTVNDPKRCAACWLHAQGVPKVLSELAAALPESWSRFSLARLPGRGRRIPGALAQMQARHASVRVELQIADRVVAVCHWLHRDLLAMGAPIVRTVVCAQGVDADWVHAESTPSAPALPNKKPDDALRVAFVGRWDRVKGLDLLLSALQAMPKNQSFQLHLAMSPASDDTARNYRDRMLPRIRADQRVHLIEGADRAAVRQLMQQSDVLAIPSQCLETGPLVALEARALGCFVLGSDLGGLRELLADDDSAQLLPFDSVSHWTEALVDLHARRLKPGFGANSKPVRTSKDVEREMREIYRQALERARTRLLV